MKQAKDLTCDEIVTLVQSIQSCLYLDLDEQGREVWNPDKSWSGDEFDFVARALCDHGLVPTQLEIAEPPTTPKKYVLYNTITCELMGTRIHEDPDLAADYARQPGDVIVVPVILPQFKKGLAVDRPQACECQQAGAFCSGVPGILAKVENCRVVLGGKVERCDLCEKYPSDKAAYDKLAELGMV